jgi:hypothetical protein
VDLWNPTVMPALDALHREEQLVNVINYLIAPDLYEAGYMMLEYLQTVPGDVSTFCNKWLSVSSGMSIIANRKTKEHIDKHGMYSCYDFLVTAGEYDECTLDVESLDIKMAYDPGYMTVICGKIFGHKVPSWNGRLRVCIAHFFRWNMFYRAKTQIPGYVQENTYIQIMGNKYATQTQPL